MRFQVPQNIDIQDSVLFGLSFVQLLYIGGAIGFLVFLLFFVGVFLAIILGGPILILAVALSFFRMNEQGFAKILHSFVKYTFNKKLYLWKKESSNKYVERSVKRISTPDTKTSAEGKFSELNTELIFDNSFEQTDNIKEVI